MLDDSTYPREAIWVMISVATYRGTIMAKGGDYFDVRTEQGHTYRRADAYRQADNEVMTVSFL